MEPSVAAPATSFHFIKHHVRSAAVLLLSPGIVSKILPSLPALPALAPRPTSGCSGGGRWVMQVEEHLQQHAWSLTPKPPCAVGVGCGRLAMDGSIRRSTTASTTCTASHSDARKEGVWFRVRAWGPGREEEVGWVRAGGDGSSASNQHQQSIRIPSALPPRFRSTNLVRGGGGTGPGAHPVHMPRPGA
eukprot:3454035-Rhodomonas_salina.2